MTSCPIPQANVAQDKRDGRRFQIQPDRTSPIRRVRYVETSVPTNGECKVCQITG
ncbi:hypothetical protein ACFOSD_04065 [Salinispirillum marinum]|uniref:Uncharacterized protein n=2 Tax=Saccharospirillaceae TaxID=255527 RepID=A0ABV8BB04_9GAMM